MRSYKFFYHYNKPASLKAGKPQATIHWKGKCLVVDHVVCKVDTFSIARKRQPVWVIAGQAVVIEIDKQTNTATIHDVASLTHEATKLYYQHLLKVKK